MTDGIEVEILGSEGDERRKISTDFDRIISHFICSELEKLKGGESIRFLSFLSSPRSAPHWSVRN